MAKKEKGCLLFLLVICTILVVLIMGVKLFIHYRAFSHLSPEQRQEYEKWLHEKIIFPSEDIIVLPFEQSTIQASTALKEQWDKHDKAALQLAQQYNTIKNTEPGDLPESDIIALKENLTTFQPLLEAFRSVIDQPDYEIEALLETINSGVPTGIPVPNFLSIQSIVKICALQSMVLSLEGRHKEAFEYAGYIIKASRTHKYSLLISRLIGIAVYTIGAHVWHSAVVQCNDRNLLQETLTMQNQLRHPEEFITSEIPMMIQDAIGTIRIAQRKGIQANIQGMTGRQITAESFRIQAEYLEKVVLPYTNDAVQRSALQKAISGYRIGEAGAGGGCRTPRTFAARLVGSFARPVFYSIAVPNFGEASTRGRVSISKFELLRMFTASKIYRLEHGKNPAAPSDLIPKFFPTTPEDPFAQNFKAINHMFYSVGPDGIDQKAAVPYDPTNGTISSGDIFFH